MIGHRGAARYIVEAMPQKLSHHSGPDELISAVGAEAELALAFLARLRLFERGLQRPVSGKPAGTAELGKLLRRHADTRISSSLTAGYGTYPCRRARRKEAVLSEGLRNGDGAFAYKTRIFLQLIPHMEPLKDAAQNPTSSGVLK